MRRTTIIIPCFNEADRLDLAAFRAYRAPDVTLLFVDDGSTDATRALLEQLHAEDGEAYRFLGLEANGGKAEAVRSGFLKAFETAPDYVGFWDADLATPLEDIECFRAVLDGRPELEAVFGSRVNLLGRSVHRKLARHYVGRVFATAASAVLRLPIYDTQCGAKLFRVNDEIIEIFRTPFISKWIFDVEIVARMVQRRRGTDLPPVRDLVMEHPLMRWEDVRGSKIRLRDFIVVGWDLARIHFRYMRGR